MSVGGGKEDGISRAQSGASQRHARQRVSGRTRKRVILLSIMLAAVMLVLVVETIYVTVSVSTLQDQKRVLSLRLADAQDQIATLSDDLAQLRTELEQILDGRFPNLRLFELNKVIELDHPQMQNIVFTRIKRGDQIFYTYRALVMNDAVVLFKPDFRILLFDRLGVHIGTAQFTDDSILAIGETDSICRRN